MHFRSRQTCILIKFHLVAGKRPELVRTLDFATRSDRLGTGFGTRLIFSLRRHGRLTAAGALLLAVAAIGATWLISSHGNRSAAAITPYPHELAQVSFAVAGDVIPHGAVRAAATAAGDGAAGWSALFADVADVFEHANFGFVNLETPVAPQHSHGTREFLFDAPIDLIDALKASGIKIVSSANNHMMDQGWAGFAETREHLRERGMLFAGTGDTVEQSWQPVITEANGIRVGWLGMTRWLNGNRNPDKADQPHVNFFPYPNESKGAPGMDEDGVLDSIKKARGQCDFLVVSIHWGTEYATAPRPEDVEMAHKMLDVGASVIVGHHPHVLQPVETYRTPDGPDGSAGRDTVIFYSLGNFLSNQSRNYVDGLMPDKAGEPRDSVIGLFSAVRKDYGPAGIRVELGHVGVLPVWGENNHNEMARRQTKTPVIHPILIDREMPPLQARLDELTKLSSSTKPLTAEQKKEFIDLTNRLKLLTDRRALLLARIGDEYVIDPPMLAGKP